MPRSRFLIHLYWKNLEKSIFSITVEAKVIVLDQPNETMTIDEYQGSRMPFDLLAMVAHIGLPSVYLNKLF